MRKPQAKQLKVFPLNYSPFAQKLYCSMLCWVLELDCSSLGGLRRLRKRHNECKTSQRNIKVTPTIEMMIEAAVKEMDIQNEKINAELKKD